VSEPLTFIASIAPLQSAITIASDGGARVKLDIPEHEMGKIARVMGLRGKVLKVTVQVVRQQRQTRDDDEEYDGT
jgi:hypothetical protein